MERVEYDPEIDPSIREAREAAEREKELSARIRVEVERYVAENDLVPREKVPEGPPWDEEPSTSTPPWEMGGRWEPELRDTRPPWEEPDAEPDAEPETPRERRRRERDEAREAREAEKEAAREAEKDARAARATSRRKAVQSVFTGSILQTGWVRRMWPYLLGIAAVLVLYIAYNFHVAGLHLDRQRLEREVRELGIEAVERTAERVRQTRRSAIVARLKEKNIPLEEFPYPVKRIEK